MSSQLEKEIEENRRQGEILNKRKNDLLHKKVDIFRQKHEYVYAIKKGKPTSRIAVFDSYEKAKSNTPSYSNSGQHFYIEKYRSEEIFDQELLKINRLPGLFSSYGGYYSP